MNITLQEDNELLDEVVVIGYGSVKRKDVTTAVSTVSTKDLDQRPIVSAAQALQGKAAGVSVMQPSGDPRTWYHLIQRQQRPALRSGRCARGQHQLSLSQRH